MKVSENISVKYNIEMRVKDHAGWKTWINRTHNIVTNTGRQFLMETITPATLLGGGGFTRTDDSVIRYVGFGIGGSRQTNPDAANPPLSTDYGGTNLQTDDDRTVGILERPVQISAGVWMKEIVTPGTFGMGGNIASTFVANFDTTDINYGPYTMVPLSEIGLYKSTADRTLPNGSPVAYPGGPGHLVAYDTFTPVPKTGIISIQVRWTWLVG